MKTYRYFSALFTCAVLITAGCSKNSDTSQQTTTFKITLKLNGLTATSKKYTAYLYDGNSPIAASSSTSIPAPTTDGSGNGTSILKNMIANNGSLTYSDTDKTLSAGNYALYVYVDYSGDGITQGVADKGKIINISLSSDTTVNLADADFANLLTANVSITGEASLNGGRLTCAWMVPGSSSSILNRNSQIFVYYAPSAVAGGAYTTSMTLGVIPGSYSLACMCDMNTNWNPNSPALDGNIDYKSGISSVSLSASGTTAITGFSLAP